MAGGNTAGSGFQVVMADLLKASDTFQAEASAFKSIMPDSGPSCPDGGDAGFDGSLQAVVALIGALHLQAAGVMENDSRKLKLAHDNYAATEESLTKLSTQITDPSAIH